MITKTHHGPHDPHYDLLQLLKTPKTQHDPSRPLQIHNP